MSALRVAALLGITAGAAFAAWLSLDAADVGGNAEPGCGVARYCVSAARQWANLSAAVFVLCGALALLLTVVALWRRGRSRRGD